MTSPTNNQIGLHIRNNYNAGYPSEAPQSPLYQLNIISNSFNSGTVGMALMNTVGIMIPYYVYDNRFIGISSGYYGIIGKKMTGNIKNTKFFNTNINQGIRLDLSDVNLYGNIVNSNEDNIRINGLSTVKMEPIINGLNYNWVGGRNKMNSKYASNLNFDNSNLPLLNFGENCFELQSTSLGSHLLGISANISSPYYCRNNSWTYTSGIHFSNITFSGNIVVPFISPVISCNNTPVFDSYSYTERGFDIIDTVGVSEREDTTTIQNDEALFAQGHFYYEEADYTSAIISYKELIDNYNNSSTLVEAVWTLYGCYSQLDTGQNETYRDDLYSDCKMYLTNKINSGNYQNEFTDAAYQVILMCEANLGKYNEAMDGYEFLINFHPDPIIRINASWDYEDIAELLGEGGSRKVTNVTNEEFRNKRLKKLDKLISRDPLKEKLQSSYNRILIKEYLKTGKVEYTKKTITSSERINIEKKIYSHNQQRMIERSVDNTRFAGIRTKEEKDKRFLEDIIISGGMDINSLNNENGKIIPSEYRLHQNYPNPFNPVTNISYQIPFDGLVKLRVYDILGKEVASLVNEVKQAG
ncbi:MAG TPA: hypothetical protein PLG90_13480, partial [Ignavibacteria bacterium]|nr:hypothetical protein [Ignavibacteria bacterium]